MVSIFDTSVLPPVPDEGQDRPRSISTRHGRADLVFRRFVTGSAAFALVVTGAIGAFLFWQVFPTLHRYGFSYFTRGEFQPELNKVGIADAIVGTIVVATIALVIAFPIAVMTALFISEYAPPRLRGLLTSLIDLMAAIPSIIYGAFGVFFLGPQMIFVSRWVSRWFGWIPIFDVPNSDPSGATFTQREVYYSQSPFIAGVVVSLMVIPLSCAIMRNVFSQAPIGEREAAYALGATRWGMVRSVVLPFGLSGIIGGTMLGLGRALGETVAVLLVLEISHQISFHILAQGGITISQLIANSFGEATGVQLSALLAAGFVLFVMTLFVNTIAAVIVSRGRSGAGIEL